MRNAKLLAKLLNFMPDKMDIAISKKILYGYLNKHANIKIVGLTNVKEVNAPIIFVCNHLSNADGLILNQVLKDKEPTFMAGVKLSNDPFTNMGMKVVRAIKIKPNSADKEAITAAIKLLKDGNNLMIFPEGTRSREGKMIKGKKGVVLISKISKATIIPIGMTGTEKLLPINKDGNMSRENFKNADVNINIGAPIVIPKKIEGEERHEYDDRCLNYIMESIAKLLPEEYRGEYGGAKEK